MSRDTSEDIDSSNGKLDDGNDDGGFIMRLALCYTCSAALLLAGCQTTDSLRPDVQNHIALCSGGVNISKSLEAKVARELTKSATLSAGIKSELQGAIFAKVSEANAATAYKDYVACVERQTAQ